jgi:hypothetical protein
MSIFRIFRLLEDVKSVVSLFQLRLITEAEMQERLYKIYEEYFEKVRGNK